MNNPLCSTVKRSSSTYSQDTVHLNPEAQDFKENYLTPGGSDRGAFYSTFTRSTYPQDAVHLDPEAQDFEENYFAPDGNDYDALPLASQGNDHGFSTPPWCVSRPLDTHRLLKGAIFISVPLMS